VTKSKLRVPARCTASKPIVLIKIIIPLHILLNNSNFTYDEHQSKMWGTIKYSFKFKSPVIKLIFHCPLS
jgi:hypothetical protein